MVFFTYDDYCNYKSSVLKSYTTVCEDNYTPLASLSSVYNISKPYSIKDVHDKLYRDFFNDSIEFSSFLKSFLNFEIEPSSLIPYNSDYITEDYKNRHSDVVYKVKNEPIYIFLEHQSSIDHSISYRIWEYYNLLLKSTVDVRKIKEKDYKLPVIIPILLYTGNRKWELQPNIQSKQYYNPYRKDILYFRYDYINISNYTIEELLNMNSMVSYLLATDKCKTQEQLLDVLEKLSNIVTDNNMKHKIRRLIIYIYKDFIEDNVRKSLLKKFEEGDEKDMKYAWDYVREDIIRQRKKAIEEGRKEGIKEGRKEGLLDAFRSVIVKMLENGESIDKIKLYSGLSNAEIEKIKSELTIA